MGLIRIVENENKYFKENEGYIELVRCPVEKNGCLDHLKMINKRMHFWRSHSLNKNFPLAIEEIKIAFYKIDEIDQPGCEKCADLFRSSILKSLESTHEDLQQMTSGFFRAKRYLSSLELATAVIQEFKVRISNSAEI